MIVFSHILNADNTGDEMSGPYRWFEFGRHVALNYSTPLPPETSAVIYGGGTMTNWLRGRTLPTVPRIGWGIGSSRHGETEPWPDVPGLVLAGYREWAPERDSQWVPCASCMSPLLDSPPEPTQPAVLFVNPAIEGRYPVTVGNLPRMENTRPMAEIIAFLASGETVVTNSYHGVYWATLLGRKVVALPYSSKFYGLRHPPAYSRDRGLDWHRHQPKVYPDALAECRTRNMDFYGRVRAAIGGRVAA